MKQWIFFLHAPEPVRALAALTFTAQQLLVPTLTYGKIDGIESSMVERLLVRLPAYSVASHYNSQQSCYLSSGPHNHGNQGLVSLYGNNTGVPRVVGPQNIDQLVSPDQGVWYPDSWLVRMAWIGSQHGYASFGGREFDPFQTTHELTTLYFTEQIDETIQWAIRQDGKPSLARGNMALASQSKKPNNLSRTAYVLMSSVRAFPNKQIRNVVLAFLNPLFPSEDLNVQKILLQALFQVGKVDVEHLKWKRDLFDNAFFMSTKAVLDNIEEEMHYSPTKSNAALLLSEVAAFFSSWNESLKAINRRIADAAVQWADDISQQITAVDELAVAGLKTKECRFLYQAVLCLAKGQFRHEDAFLLIRLTCRCYNLRMGLNSLTTEQARELNRYQSRCLEALTARFHLMLGAVENDPCILTEALREVVQVPSRLTWHPFLPEGEKASTCFETVARDSCVYTLNILTGAVLVNGSPPSSLPPAIHQHPLFKQTFGQSYFRVVPKLGLYETANEIEGRLYQFFLNGNALHITELDRKSGRRFELLDAADSVTWGSDLPVRLRELYSHWLCRDMHCVVLRGKVFKERATDFVLRVEDKSTATVSCRCIPINFRESDLADIMKHFEMFDELVKHESIVTKTLERIEIRDFIHVIRRQSDILFHLPRFRLSFCYQYGEEIRCQDFPDLRLSKEQLLPAFWGFQGYLVAEKTDSSQSRGKCIIFPDGRVEIDGSMITVRRNAECDADCRWHRIYVHERLGFFCAADSVARLQMAALHVATSHLVPNRITGMRGDERAIEVLRQCWTPAPLSPREQSALQDIFVLSAGKFPNSVLLCLDILQTSEQTAFLYTSSKAQDETIQMTFFDKGDEITAYLSLQNQFRRNRRPLLTEEEEIRVLGHTVQEAEAATPFNPNILDGCKIPLLEDVVEVLEMELKHIVTGTQQPMRHDRFPLDLPESSGPLETSIFTELKASWVVDKERSFANNRLRQWSSKIDEINEKVKSSRTTMEDYLLSALNVKGDQFEGTDVAVVSSLRLSNELPTASTADLVRVTYKPNMIASFNPLLSSTGQKKLLQGIVLWLRLCVLEDKITRLGALVKIGDIEALNVELGVTRTFNGDEYPAWVAFEVENHLQIRPEQFLVAKHLLDNPGHLIQLNMGSGKTRVILPMLVLHLSLHRKDYDHITRLTVLSALLKENVQFFRGQLTGSLAFVKVFMMPFCREIELNETRVECMVRLARQCSRERGIMMVAPEHRLSMELKLKEMLGFRQLLCGSSICAGLQHLCGGIWRDILDECDELLHHRFQLIYACGNVEELPAGAHRFRAVQALFSMFCFDQKVKKFLLSHPDVFVGAAGLICVKHETEKFPALRVNAQTALNDVVVAFRSVLANAMLTNPPYEFHWLRNHASADDLKAAIAEPLASTQSLEGLPEQNKNDILALRGLLAGDLLWHCLQKRHWVDFGIARPGKKRICVPFRGADTPSLRSEFSHPEVTITLTTVAYYQDGLDEEQVRQAFDELLSLGSIAKRSYYDKWFELSKQRIRCQSPELEASVDAVEKLDPTNPYQFKILVKYFSNNMLTINFWLNTCVFPEEMQHHPQRLTANSWHLANNPSHKAIGFSGTNDNHRILPLQVTQFFKEDFTDSDLIEADIWREMMGTNGRMVDVILKNTTNCIELKPGKRFEPFLTLLTQMKNVLTIIDAGALFVGTCNKEVASNILETVTKSCNAFADGVIYYENRPSEAEGWMVMERSGRILPKEISPVAEHRAFAFFDERRCRGSDLKLASNAVALLTLAPKMRKDTFMQAAGRMRKLGFQQKLVLVGMSDVVHEIRRTGSSKFDIKNILYWTLKNTVSMNEGGLMPWTNQGLFFATTQATPELAMQDDDCSLHSLYSASFAEEPLSRVALLIKESLVARVGCQSALSSEQRQMIDKIIIRSNRFGTHFVCTVKGMDEECERELELEREVEEEEEEIEIPQMAPLNDLDWDLNSVFASSSPSKLPVAAGVGPLTAFVKENLTPKTLDRIHWTGMVFGTRNFFQSVRHASGAAATSLNYYLHPIDVVVRFSSGEMLLVSEREADSLLELLWDRRDHCVTNRTGGTLMEKLWKKSVSDDRLTGQNEQHVEFFHFDVLRTAYDARISGLTPSSLALSSNGDISSIRLVPDDVIAEIQLFAGETTYGTDSRKRKLKAMLTGGDNHVSACGEPEHFVEMRNLSQTLPFSDLEKICYEVAKETGEAFAAGGMRH